MENSSSSSLGLTKVVLYKHGIGYFERRGKVTGPTNIDLVCEASEIDDMLKSLLALTGSGSRIDAITYDSSKTLESRLAEFGFDISQSNGLTGLLAQMKGIPVTITVSGETISGRVLGLDENETIVNEHILREEQLTLYTAESNFKRINLSAISSIKVEDESMAAELKQQLELLFQNAKKKDRKALSVSLSDAGEHDVVIAYSIPCPIWKTSYRLVMSDKKVLLQGMAIVDNVQEEDWNAVQIVLVSASPISFIQPLYDPVMPYRRRIAAQGIASSGPVVAERAKREQMPAMMRKRMDSPPAPAAMAREAEAWGAPVAQSYDYAEMAAGAPMDGLMEVAFAESISVESGEKGELFEYRITRPVTIPRNSSALIPIVQQDIEGERISLYNVSKNPKFPHAAIRFVNNTGLTLETGPVTVMEGDIYAGEALMDTVKPDDLRFLMYAIDQSCPVTERDKSISKPHWRVRSYNGVIYVDYKLVSEKTYEMENLSEQKKVVFVEHPLRQGWTIVSEEKPAETTQNYYRFRCDIDPKHSLKLVVSEESDTYEQLWISDPGNMDVGRMQWLSGQNFVDADFVQFIKKLLEQRSEMQSLLDSLNHEQTLLKQYTEDQARARENLKTLGASNERYRKVIDSTEDLINETNRKIRELYQIIQAKKKAYSELALTRMNSDLDSAGKKKR